MEDRIEVSVICNVYNHGRYLRDALDGFIMQKTNFPFEVLIHDDASTDDSAAIIREYEEKYPELIKPIYQTENKYSKKVNIDIVYQYPRVKGKYVAFCEGDDYWTDPLKLQKQYDFMEKNPEYTLCACSTIWLDMNTGKQRGLCRIDVDRDVSLEEIILEKKGRVFQYATLMVRVDVISQVPEWMKHFGVGDAPLAIQAALVGKVHMLADVVAVYRNHAQGSWTSRVAKDVQYRIKMFEQMIDGLTMLNEATEYHHDRIIARRIKQLRYNIARIRRDWRAMRTGELREIYQSRSFMARMYDMMACKCPTLSTLIKKVIGK